LRRLLEQDRRELEKTEDKVGSLEQDVEVLTKKINDQRPNNRAARGQLLGDLIRKRRALREERRWLENYREHVRTGEARLRVLLRRVSSNAAN
jgi:chromosome segregation ATPase